MTALAQGVYALTHTKRRRFLWCAWWKTTPQADPFVPPDAWGAGLRTEAEAIAAAQTMAGMTLQRIEGRWAGAWVRARAGLPPFIERGPKPTNSAGPNAEAAQAKKAAAVTANPFRVLGLAADADLAAIKAAYRQLALNAHPDRGGSDAAFIAANRAYLAALQRQRRKR